MRGVLLSLALAVVALIAAPSQPSASTVFGPPAISMIALQESPAPTASPDVQKAPAPAPNQKIEISVDNRGNAVTWYRNPVWIAIGVLAVIVVLLLIVLVSRGNDMTVIRQ